jgi:hypothetical protein
MAGKRDFIGELKAYVKRSALAAGDGTTTPDAPRWGAIITALACAKTGDISDEKLCEELRRHVVVSLVAMIQASARRTIVEIIDGKEERGEELPELKDITITLAMVRELKKREFSIGALVAHFASLGGFEQISSALQRVSGEDLNTILLNSFRYDTRRIDGFKSPEEALADTRAQLVRLFSYRNIYCHEEGVGMSVKDDELQKFFIATLNVVSALGLLGAKVVKR